MLNRNEALVEIAGSKLILCALSEACYEMPIASASGPTLCHIRCVVIAVEW
jgi:hypothetical protein